jgi:SAM-dependent MidA family methyltransferase
MNIRQFLINVTANPWVNILVAVAMLISAGNEIWQSIQSFELGAHHGVFLYALLQCLKALPDVMEPLNKLKGVDAD